MRPEQESSSEQRPDLNFYYLVHNEWEKLLEKDTELLYGDENPGDPETEESESEAPSEVNGIMRNFDGSNGITVVARYDPERRAHMAEILNRKVGLEISESPIGHIGFEKVTREAQVAIDFYLLESEQVLAAVQCSLADPEEALSEDAEACYDLADRTGVGNLWVKFLFSSSRSAIITSQLDNAMKVRLGSHLRTVQTS